jgi:CheY-like chemotaxis protein
MSAIDHGSTFWVELPLTDMPASDGETTAPDATATHPIAPATTPGLVLYIEDNQSNVRLMQRVFERRPGVQLVHAPSGHEGLEMARQQQPDLIFLDLHLPDISGEHVLRQLKEDVVVRGIPVAVLSADAMPDQPKHLQAAGAMTYLTKPLDIARVLRVLDDALGKPTG